MGGRPPKPAAIKRLEGNRGLRPIPEEVRFDGVPIRPADLSGLAAWLWDLVVPTLANLGLATRPDTPALIALCQWWQVMQLAVKKADETQEPKDIAAAAKATSTYNTISGSFGLNPVARAKLAMAKPHDAAADEFASFLLADAKTN